MTDRDNPPAFPSPAYDNEHYWGMDLRDWLAAKALPFLTAYYDLDTIAAVAKERGVSVAEAVAAGAYEVADAMMAEREKRK